MIRRWTDGGGNSKLFLVRDAYFNVTDHGSLDSGKKIPASAFELGTIVECSPAIKGANEIALPTAPSYDGANLLLLDGSNAPANFSGQYRITVKGTRAS